MYRKRSEDKAYKKMPRSKGCPYCDADDPQLNPRPRTIYKDTEHMAVIANIFPYHLWEHMDVLEHLLLIPKRHVTTMKDLATAERHDMMDIMCEYEAAGYNVYTRSPHTTTRTLPHIHTHLIKIGSTLPHVSVYIKRPYWVIKF